mmetsp:Transcript_139601/g.242979  ORF Transcript_139601/g.242979 Transcript_139601/m.242979 type:complete len:214 (-) Transcript_139601:39-680(-)
MNCIGLPVARSLADTISPSIHILLGIRSPVFVGLPNPYLIQEAAATYFSKVVHAEVGHVSCIGFLVHDWQTHSLLLISHRESLYGSLLVKDRPEQLACFHSPRRGLSPSMRDLHTYWLQSACCVHLAQVRSLRRQGVQLFGRDGLAISNAHQRANYWLEKCGIAYILPRRGRFSKQAGNSQKLWPVWLGVCVRKRREYTAQKDLARTAKAQHI